MFETVGGIEKNNYEYTNTLVYIYYIFPNGYNTKEIVSKLAFNILNVRKSFPQFKLKYLYNPQTMPDVLLKAHKELDKVIETAYIGSTFSTDAERVALLMDMYQQNRQ